MSRPLENNKGTRMAILVLLALAILLFVAAGIAVADHPDDQDANQGGSGQTELAGDWDVGAGDDLYYGNQTILLDGNLTVTDGGRLVLKNVTLVLHGAELDPQEILLADGELVITDWDNDPYTQGDRSVIRADDPEVRYYFGAYEGTTLTLTNSYVRDCGRLFNIKGYNAGIYVATEDATIDSVEVAYGYAGIFIDEVAITVASCNIHDNEWVGIYVDNAGNPTIEDCTVEASTRDGIVVKGKSNAVVRSSFVRGNNKGIVVEDSFMAAHDTAISSNDEVDIDLPYFGQVELFNCTISGTTTPRPVRMENSSLTSTHGNFDIGSVDMTASVFRYQQFLTVKVTWADSVSTPIPDVPVTVVDFEDQTFNYATGSDGQVANVPMLVVEYDKRTPILKTFTYNPFLVKVSYNLLDQDELVDMRYDSAVVTFQYNDVQNPVAVAPGLRDVNVGVETVLDGSACRDNVAIAEWNWSFEEFGAAVYFEGEMATCVFMQAKVYTITLRVTDTSGNTGTSGVTTFQVTAQDRIPPVADAGDDLTVPQGVAVVLDGSQSTDNVGVVSWTWSYTYAGAPKSLTGVSVTVQFDIAGTYVVALVVEDAAGLSGTTSITIVVEDTTPPTTVATITPELGGDRKSATIVQVSFTVSGEPAGTVDLYYRVNGGEWQQITGGLALSFGGDLQYGDGSYELEYYAMDQSGNAEDIKTIPTFMVDATPPDLLDLDPPINPFTTAEETYTISGRTEVGATLTINSVAVPVQPDGTFTYSVNLDVGDNSFYLLAEDGVGNTDQLNLVITRTKYGTTTTDDGGNLGLVVGAVVAVIVILLIIVYFVMLRRKGGEAAPQEQWEET